MIGRSAPPTHPTDAELVGLFETMARIRRFEEKVYDLFLQGGMPGTIHLYIGQEAVAAGVCAALRPDDFLTSTHRAHGHAIAKGVPLDALMAELFGKAAGCCRGKGGSMHVGDVRVGAVPSLAVVGAGIPIAAGLGLAFKRRGLGQIAVCFFGEGAANEGTFHEGINLAAIWDLPVVFVCENNLYGASTRVDKVMRVADVADRAGAYGIPGVVVDGNDVVAVNAAAAEAVARARAGAGPTLLECKTYRHGGHSRSDPGHYRSAEEVAGWKARDPIATHRARLTERGLAASAALEAIDERVQAAVDEAVELARAAPAPDAGELLRDVYWEGTTAAPAPPRPARRADGRRAGATRQLTVVEALREAMREEMARDGEVIVLGEDVGVEKGFGGAFTVTLGLAEEFGHERVIDTPISEAGYAGLAIGAALVGFRPIVDLQYADFIFCMMDQIVNEAAKLCYMSGGQVRVPIVVRAPVGATTRGAQHSQTPEAVFMHVPGLKVVAPSTAYDAKGLLKAAIRDDNPVIFLEHKLLYGSKGTRVERGALSPVGEVPLGEYTVPLGVAAVRREGGDLTIVATMLMVYRALEAAERLAAEGIEAEVIDLRSLAPLDADAVLRSVEKTGHLLLVDEDHRICGWTAEVAALAAERALHHLRAPVVRVTAADAPTPFAPSLERLWLPDAERIFAAALELVVR
ncbi:MAG TPA: dehydrogenase E1 component subunit alpha/beta [Chloroflexota bacterium]|jgi:pyruvate/2-oxoglutarate/acetoin dehydrogenase E1 component/TPP-dependent pyruvate/acetoin dehydrogenase alpha subunit